jgi:hypothetical protein
MLAALAARLQAAEFIVSSSSESEMEEPDLVSEDEKERRSHAADAVLPYLRIQYQVN